MATARMPQPTAEDPVKVDPKHYKVEFENDGVRVLRVKYGAREKSVMHSHFSTSPAFIRQAALSVIRNKLQVISDTATAQELQFAEFC